MRKNKGNIIPEVLISLVLCAFLVEIAWSQNVGDNSTAIENSGSFGANDWAQAGAAMQDYTGSSGEETQQSMWNTVKESLKEGAIQTVESLDNTWEYIDNNIVNLPPEMLEKTTVYSSKDLDITSTFPSFTQNIKNDDTTYNREVKSQDDIPKAHINDAYSTVNAKVTIGWDGSWSPDIAGYNIYALTTGESYNSMEKINDQLITGNSFDINLPLRANQVTTENQASAEGSKYNTIKTVYEYPIGQIFSVVAVDTGGLESSRYTLIGLMGSKTLTFNWNYPPPQTSEGSYPETR